MKLMCQSYGYIGWIQFFGAFFAFYVVANDFGFKASELNGKASISGYEPNSSDRYNPTDPYFGNTKISKTSCSDAVVSIDWIYTLTPYDLRLSALTCSVSNGVAKYSQIFNWG